MSLLDFLSQRFTLMETEEHRYLYVVQVHLPLLRRFGQLCDARGRRLISALAKKTSDAKTQNAWAELFVVVNALQHVAHALAAWEQSSVFWSFRRRLRARRRQEPKCFGCTWLTRSRYLRAPRPLSLLQKKPLRFDKPSLDQER